MSHRTPANGAQTKRLPVNSIISDLKRLWPYIRPYSSYLVIAFLALLAAAGTVLAMGHGLRQLVDRGLAAGDAQLLDQALFGMLGVVLLLAVASALRFYFVNITFERVTADLRHALYVHMMGFSSVFFETRRTPDLISRFVSDTALLRDVFGGQMSGAIRNLIVFLGGMALMAITSPLLTGFVLAAMPLFFAPIIIYGRRVRQISQLNQQHQADMVSHVGECLQGMGIVQAYNHEDLDLARYGALNTIFLESARYGLRNRAFLTFGIISIVFGCVGVILWFGGREVLTGGVSMGELTAFIFYAILVTAAFASLSEAYGGLMRASGAAERVFEILDMTPAIVPPTNPKALPTPSRGALNFANITFAYEGGEEHSALSHFDLQVAPGERVALVGPSGAGKSTVFRLLLRFYDPQSGTVHLDGVNIRDCHPSDLRARFGLVSQEPVIFAATIADNIRYGRPEADMSEIEAAAEDAAAADFIRAMPQGYETKLGERGIQLSGGQKQRLAIARAILRKPAVLLLDEATSSLDAENEVLVQTALDRLMAGRTTLVIAHRLSTVRKCDRIIVMSHGRIIDQGAHEELVAKDGLYAHYVALQQEDDASGFGEDRDATPPKRQAIAGSA